MKSSALAALLALLGASFAASSCATTTQVDPEVQTVLAQTTEKLRNAKTIHVSGSRTSDPELLPPGMTAESAKFDLEAVRPGNLEVKSVDASGTRHLIAGNGKLVYYDEKAKVYSTLPTKAATLDGLVDDLEDQYDIKMVVGELLGSDPQKTLLEGVTSGKVAGVETVNGVPCTRLRFTQADMTWDLWIAKSDALPRKTVVVYTDKPGHPKRTVVINRWQLNAVLPESDFAFSPPKDAQAAEVIH
jgi:hypothetical protein